MEVPEERLTAATFEELAMPLFDQLYNFAHWLTQNRSEAEDLVQETYVKALKGFSLIFGRGSIASCETLSSLRVRD
jgi:RNA polymerase sigma-70 factor (ECF subfamily)